MAGTPNSIITPQSVQSLTQVMTLANTTYTSTPTATAGLIIAGASGARVTRITAIPRATVTATMLQLYRSLDIGTTKHLFRTKLMSAHTVAATTEIPQTDFGYSEDNPLILGAGEYVFCAIAVALADGIAFSAEWSNY